MRKLILIPLLLVAILLSSCDEPFSPKGKYLERYALFGIMRADTNLQVVTVTKSYDVEGLNPYANKKDPFIKNCFIRIWRGNDEVHILRDSATVRNIDKRYSDSAHFYYTNNFTPQKGDELSIECLLPNGRRLKATTKVIQPIEIDYSGTDLEIPVTDKKFAQVKWRSSVEDLVYSPQVELYYDKAVNGRWELHTVKVPMKYAVINGHKTPIWPSPSHRNYVQIDTVVVGQILKSISEGDPNKSHYRIRALIFSIYIYDRNLSAFYSSSKKIGDEFSVRVDERDFTNIDGGFGVFGSYTEKKTAILFTEKYIRSFGYVPLKTF